MKASLPLGLAIAVCTALVPTPDACAAETLRDQPSVFLRQHEADAVRWMSWGDAAFARAKNEQKPVFLAIGLFTSELSRAMSRQTFSNPETAGVLNENFICVLVDAKEFRDLTQLNLNYLGIAKQLTGLPMNLFLTPELKPFDGANYLPPTEEWGKEGFGTVLKRALGSWKADPAIQRTKADDAVAAVEAAQHVPSPSAVDAKAGFALLKEATAAWKSRFDATNGGFGDPPKYVEPELIRFLLRNAATRDVALRTLGAAMHGGIRDPLDGGFFRYALDAEWRQPYFQKNLVDQPRIALAFLEAAKLSNEAEYAEVARGALLYAAQQLGTTAENAPAAEDATADTLVESYLWTLDEIKTAVGLKNGAEFATDYGASAEGNLAADAIPGVTTAGKNLLRRVTPQKDAAAELSLSEAAAKLLELRKQRPAPVRDNAASVGTHGLLLAGFAQAGAQLKDARLAAAGRAEFAVIRDRFISSDGSLRRLPGSRALATADDYAAVIAGLLTYGSTMNDSEASDLAAKLTKELIQRFWDAPAARFFATGPKDGEHGIWARVHFAAPGAGEPASAESLLLLALAEHKAADAASRELSDSLARGVAADIKEAAEVARGDLLLAFQAYQQSR